MTWLEAIKKSICYIEEHLTDELTVEQIANEVYISPFYFQKGFSILCEMTVSEYIRNRRLSLAGRDLRIDGSKVIDVAMKYGYDSPDSFTKAFTRFHGITPVQAKNGEGELKNFLPLKVQKNMEEKIFAALGTTGRLIPLNMSSGLKMVTLMVQTVLSPCQRSGQLFVAELKTSAPFTKKFTKTAI